MIKKYWRVLVLVAVLGLLVWGWFFLRNPSIFPIEDVMVKATYEHVNSQDLQQIIMPYTKASFFGVDVRDLQHDLLQLPWVYAANISRVWPNKLLVQITEQHPVAVWNGNSLLNLDIKIFTPAVVTMPTDLPELIAPDPGKAREVWYYYQQMSQLLQPLELTIKSLKLSADGGWDLVLDNGIKVYLGNVNFIKRLGRFINAYSEVIEPKSDKIYSIDLRYSSGFAIQWKLNNK